MESEQDNMTYSRAMDELESIAGQLENESLDPDSMLQLIRRAEVLVNFCKAKLSETEKSVEGILNRLNQTDQQTDTVL